MYLCPKGASMFFLISARQKYIDLEVFPLSFLERTRAGIKEAFAYAEGYEETVTALGVNLLKSADRENRLEYLKGLAARQKAAAKKFKRKDPVTSLLNWSDYYRTMADITALEKEIEELDLTTCQLCDEVKDCYLSPVDLEESPSKPILPKKTILSLRTLTSPFRSWLNSRKAKRPTRPKRPLMTKRL